ncbi:MAG TPA: SulP family inorganic anion transporter [Xanthobacteraceae bacterium]|nr:SulP family inorganic anion transporter [Xanthobacteraceae bacterium]
MEKLRDDLIGGLVSAAVAVPLAIGFGMFAFVALGDAYFAYGAVAGLYAAIVMGAASVAFGDRTTTVYAPRVTTTFFLGGLLYQLVHSDLEVLRSGGHQLIILVFFSMMLLGGLLQALFGLVRLGSVLRFTPHPVMAGLQNAAAALLFLVQLGNIAGFERYVPFTNVFDHLAEIKPLSLAVAAVTFVTMWKARAITTKIPPLLMGLGIGTAVYFALEALGFGAQLGPVIGLRDAPESTAPLKNLGDLAYTGSISDLLPLVLGGALALAIIAALDALLCAKLVTPPGAPKVDGDRLMVRLGFGNALAACFGGITGGINIGASIANRNFGGRTWASVLINAAVLLLVVVALFPVIAFLPRAVLSAAIMVIAVQHIDPWSIDLVHRIRTRAARHRALMLLDLAVVVLVAVLSVTIDIVLAVFLGIFIAIALFVLRMSRSNIRRMYRCDAVHSRKARGPAQAALLEREGAGILVLELQGALFFGSAETLSNEIEKAAAGTRSVILDLRRVTEIDATGAQILAEIAAALARQERQLALSLTRNGEVAARLGEAGVLEALEGRVFDDVDRAIEWAEESLLRGAAGGAAAESELPLAQVALLRDLTPQEAEAFASHSRRAVYPAGSEIFKEGDPGKELFIITRGRASAYLRRPDGDIRLATFAPGTVFGELAILDAGPRSASVTADDEVVCHVLSADDFAALFARAPATAIKLLSGLGRELSARLRRANKTIHQLES